MKIFRLKDKYYNESSLYNLQRFNSTKDLFYNDGYIARYTTTEDRTQEEIENLVESGKIAVFPIYANQGMESVIGHIKMSFNVFFMRYSVFEKFRKNYIENCVNSSKVIVEELQQELPL